MALLTGEGGTEQTIGSGDGLSSILIALSMVAIITGSVAEGCRSSETLMVPGAVSVSLSLITSQGCGGVMDKLREGRRSAVS